MDQQARKRDSTDIEPKYQQSRKEGNSGMTVEEHEKGHKKRCKTKPEENISNIKILKSSLRRSDPTELRYPDSEIKNLLDNMPRRTYYNYVKKLQEQDMQIVE
ncbi:MAG TPA: hypothetical protein VKA87_10515 [Nitrososphaeraceae archaeon]|nr:hypothetical protein [Nitrososphaeraceae archaeon]